MPRHEEPLREEGVAGAQERQQTCANAHHTSRAREAQAGAKATGGAAAGGRRLDEVGAKASILYIKSGSCAKQKPHAHIRDC